MDDGNDWESKLCAEGLAPLDEHYRNRVFVRPRVSSPISSLQDDRKEYSKTRRWCNKESELLWSFYCAGIARAEIARIFGRNKKWADNNIYRIERDRKRKRKHQEPVGNEVLEEFVLAQQRFALPEPVSVTKYKRRRAINLWRP